MICGVCSGLANYLNIDPTIVRLLWVIVSLCVGAGLIAYLICAIVIPENPNPYYDNEQYWQQQQNEQYNQQNGQQYYNPDPNGQYNNQGTYYDPNSVNNENNNNQ